MLEQMLLSVHLRPKNSCQTIVRIWTKKYI